MLFVNVPSRFHCVKALIGLILPHLKMMLKITSISILCMLLVLCIVQTVCVEIVPILSCRIFFPSQIATHCVRVMLSFSCTLMLTALVWGCRCLYIVWAADVCTLFGLQMFVPSAKHLVL